LVWNNIHIRLGHIVLEREENPAVRLGWDDAKFSPNRQSLQMSKFMYVDDVEQYLYAKYERF
jgi:hypothetical protein